MFKVLAPLTLLSFALVACGGAPAAPEAPASPDVEEPAMDEPETPEEPAMDEPEAEPEGPDAEEPAPE